MTSAPADGKGPFLSKVNPTRLAKRAIVLNQPDGGAIVSPKPMVHDVLFNPTNEGREHVISMEILESLDPSGPQESSEVFRNPSSRVKVEHELTIL
jgi:hypothetical protein